MKATRLAVAILVCGLTASGPAAANGSGANRDITVMTRNVYHGVDAEIFAVVTAATPAGLRERVRAVYDGYHARNFPERAAALAAEIDAARPDLLGLQEVILVRTQKPSNPGSPATTVYLDYLTLLLDALASRGLEYEVAATSFNFDAQLPSACPESTEACFDVRHTVRDVVLVAKPRTSNVRLTQTQSGHFAAACPLPSPLLGSIPIVRGWVSVDMRIRGREFRFISTHLDGDCTPFTPLFQQAQTAELLAGPAATTLPLVMVGDFNSPADLGGGAYGMLRAAGFDDAWADAGMDPGATCCQADDVLNAVSILSTRIDLVLTRAAFTVQGAELLGADPAGRTPSGLWPSDHAGVAARLSLPRHP